LFNRDHVWLSWASTSNSCVAVSRIFACDFASVFAAFHAWCLAGCVEDLRWGLDIGSPRLRVMDSRVSIVYLFASPSSGRRWVVSGAALGTASSSLQEAPRASRSLQQPPGPSRASRTLQEPPGALRSLQEPPAASRSLQQPPGAYRSRSLQEPPGTSRSL